MFKDWGTCVQGAATLSCIGIVLQNIITAALLFAGVVSLFMIIVSSIRFLISGGDAKQIEGARNTLTWAIVGLIVVLVSFLILNFIGFITGSTEVITKFELPKP